MQDVLKKYFQFDEYETTFKKEIIAGTTNFLTLRSMKPILKKKLLQELQIF